MVSVQLFLDKEENEIVKRIKDKWKEEGMEEVNKNAVIKRIIREYGKQIKI